MGFPGESAGEAMVSRSDLIAAHCFAGNFLGALAVSGRREMGFPGELAGEAMVSRLALIAAHCSAGNFFGALTGSKRNALVLICARLEWKRVGRAHSSAFGARSRR